MIYVQKYLPAPFEVVERKGLGHPDTLADGISESISRDLCRLYLEEFGQIQHYNVDKVLIIAGQSHPEFGAGQILKPPTVVVGGRATESGKKQVKEVIENSAASLLKSTVGNLSEFRVEPRAGGGAPELRSLIGRGANDTSIGVGFAPLDRVEKMVLEIEPKIREIRGVGEDTKIMAVRNGEDLQIVVSCAMVSKYIGSMEEYEDAKLNVRDEVLRIAGRGAAVAVNAADHGENIFLTVTGTSIEMGDDGATGRGNRGNGLITPMRPMTMEAIAGKNPVSHVGKIYNVLAERAAADISKLDGVEEAYVTLVSKIGAPLNEPLIKGVTIFGDAHLGRPTEFRIESIVDYWLDDIDSLVEEFVEGKLTVY